MQEWMMEFVKQYYPYIAGLFVGGTSFLIPLTRELWIIILRSFITRKAIIRIFIHFGDWLVSLSNTKIDDELWGDARKSLIEEISK